MKRTLIALGCGNTIEDALPTGRALTRLQERCWWMDELQIQDLFTTMRIFKDEGISQGETLLIWGEACEEAKSSRELPLGIRDCVSCVLGITEDVYD